MCVCVFCCQSLSLLFFCYIHVCVFLLVLVIWFLLFIPRQTDRQTDPPLQKNARSPARGPARGTTWPAASWWSTRGARCPRPRPRRPRRPRPTPRCPSAGGWRRMPGVCVLVGFEGVLGPWGVCVWLFWCVRGMGGRGWVYCAVRARVCLCL